MSARVDSLESGIRSRCDGILMTPDSRLRAPGSFCRLSFFSIIPTKGRIPEARIRALLYSTKAKHPHTVGA